MKTYIQKLIFVLAIAGAPLSLIAQELPQIREALYSGSTSSRSSGRSAVFVDPIIHAYAKGNLTAPQVGDSSGKDFRGEDQSWTRIELDEAGVIQADNIRGGYVYATYESKQRQTVILNTNGNSEVFVNGIPRGGDGYGKGWMILPVELKQGRNEIWYRVSRGRNKSIALSVPPKPIYLTDIDMTVPDFLSNEIGEKWAAIRFVNTTKETINGFTLEANVAGVILTTKISESVAPMTTRKIPFKLQDVANGPGDQAVHVSLYQDGRLIDEIDITLEVRPPSRNYRRTFISEIDGSLQYYGVRQGTAELGKKPALFLSTHGAGVKAIGQAGAYQSKDWGHVIAPTNRREFGFDWEDWGRLDAMEVLSHAESAYGTDPERTYLTGHSMGGHGAWYLGATYPARWGAIAPMAGWRSFFSYGGKSETDEEPTAMEQMLSRASNPSRTMEMSHNYLQHGVYISHGSADRNVPVEEARFMHAHLSEFHRDMAYFEEPGGGHVYGMDQQPIFDFFKWHQVKDIRDLDEMHFRISSPGISAVSRYITLYQQEESYEYCGVVATQSIRSRRERRNDEDIDERTISIETENLKIFRIDLSHCDGFKSVEIVVDGQAIEGVSWPGSDFVWLDKQAKIWVVVDEPNDPSQKNPVRYGGFKDAFRHRMVFVYSTGGSEEENRWSISKARFDAETFYYRGNGAMDVISDTDFSLDGYKDRSVIIYGNSTSNKAWNLLLSESPVQVKRGEVRVGDRILKGDDYGIYMVRPRLDSAIASVGVVAGTGEQGFRSVDPNRYFVAGTGYPDLMVITPEMYSEGLSGVKVAGYFGNDWSVEKGQIVWSE